MFRIQVISNADVRSPIITLGSTSFFHVRVNNVFVLAVTKSVYFCTLSCYWACLTSFRQQMQRQRSSRLRALVPLHEHLQVVL